MPENALELVERVRRFAMPEGAGEWSGAWLRQRGELRFGPVRPWLPFAFGLGPPFSWQEAAANRLRAAFDDGGVRAAVVFDTDDEGRVLGVSVPSRPRLVGERVVPTAWSGAFKEYRTYGRLRIPTAVEVTWHLPEGPFTYWRGHVTDFRVEG
jgi:hypothetical protein